MLKTLARAFDPEPDAITMLMADHRKVEALFEEYAAARNKRQQHSIALKICDELDVHTRVEEGTFYPAVKAVNEAIADEVNEGLVEHGAVKQLIKEVRAMKPEDELFHAKVTVIIEYVKHHVKEEERDMFPKVVEQSELDLKALAERMTAAKQKAQQNLANSASKPRRAPARRSKPAARSRAKAASGRRGNSHAGRSRSRSSGAHASA